MAVNKKGTGRKKRDKRKANRTETLSLLIIFVTIILSLILTINMTIKKGTVGSDIEFHYKLAEGWAKGQNMFFNDIAGGPYPPLMHLFLAVFIFLGVGTAAVYTLQIILFPSIMAVTAFVFTKLWDVKKAAIAVALLFSSIGFFDRGIQVAPQAFDMLLFPLAAYLYFKKRYTISIIILSALLYLHGWYAAMLISGLALFVLFEKKEIRSMRFFLTICIISLPILFFMVIYLPGYAGFAKFDHPKELQESMIVKNPLVFFEYLGIALSIAAISAITIYAYKKMRNHSFFHKWPDIFAYFWIISMTPILYFGMHRFITYIAQPLAIVSASAIMKTRFMKTGENRFIAIILAISFISLLFGLFFWIILADTNASFFITNYI